MDQIEKQAKKLLDKYLLMKSSGTFNDYIESRMELYEFVRSENGFSWIMTNHQSDQKWLGFLDESLASIGISWEQTDNESILCRNFKIGNTKYYLTSSFQPGYKVIYTLAQNSKE